VHRLGRSASAVLAAAALCIAYEPPSAGAAAGSHAVPTPAAVAASAPPVVLSSRIDPRLQAQLAQAGGDPVDVMVVLNSQADLSRLQASTRKARLAAVERRLRDHAAATQTALLEFLRARRADGSVLAIKPLWITNEIAVTATAETIPEIASLPDVLAVRPDAAIAAPPPPVTTAAESGSVEPNVSAIHAPDLWSRGFHGQHTVVASMDTGVDASHPDLAASFRGGTNSWYDPNGEHPSTPTDVNGHGTQTMGVIVAGAAGGTSVGVAPEASWIAVKIFNDRGTATTAGIHLGFQWLLDPDGDPSTPDAPNVVNNSWTGSVTSCSLEFQPDLAGLRAAGIVPVFAVGNSGPAPGSVLSPANLPEALAVGGTDNTGALDPESGRGPSSCAGAVAPGVVAPGVGIRTTDLYGGYIADTGTSVAAPHVTGAIALLLSAFPGASADRVQAAIEGSAADLGPSGVDPDYGFGWVDADAAYVWMAGQPDFTVSASPSAATVVAGTTTSFTISVAALSGYSSDVSLSLSGLSAAQGSWQFTPSTIAGGSGDAQLSVTTSASLAEGVYPLTVSATDGTLTRSATIDLTVQPPPDFSIAATPSSASTTAGGGVAYTVGAASVGSFADQVALSLSGLPASVGSASLTPASIAPGESSQLAVSTLAGAPAGTYRLTVTGSSGTLTHSAQVTLTVSRPPPNFALAVSPSSITVRHGQTAAYTVSVTSVGGLRGKVALSASGTPPGTVAKFGRVNLPVPGSTMMRVRTYASTHRGTYSITVSARHTTTTVSHQVVVTLTIT
jgi:subtilisin family serine protease